MTDFSTARDEILDLFYQKWKTDTPALNSGAEVEVAWPGVEYVPDASKPWARIVTHHGSNASLTLGPPRQSRITRTGIVAVQVFAPTMEAGGLLLCQNLGIIARSAFERQSTPSGVWFRNVQLREVGTDGAWHQMTVTAQFEYDETV